MAKSFSVRLYWLIHHDTLLEANDEPIENRIRHIKNDKPLYQQETRLKWMRPVKHPHLLPKPVIKALHAYARALHRQYKDWTYDNIELNRNALEELKHQIRAFRKEVRLRHQKECRGCPFSYKASRLRFPTDAY